MKHYRLTMYEDGKFVGPAAMMLGTNTGPLLTMTTATSSNMAAS